MPIPSRILFAIFCILAIPAHAQEGTYFPPAGDEWETIAPEDAGFNPVSLERAITFAVEKRKPDLIGIRKVSTTRAISRSCRP